VTINRQDHEMPNNEQTAAGELYKGDEMIVVSIDLGTTYSKHIYASQHG
jgi:hypothetical protein